ncbi:MAG: hypothetical protein ACYTFY_15390 [Planctomycetota bacterium]|jgi:hypothetical protein
MIRYTCDKCGKEIYDHETRFEARVDAGPVYDENLDLFEELDFSGEESLTEMMERLDREAWQDGNGGSFKFDMCEKCYNEFISSSVFQGVKSKSGFRR